MKILLAIIVTILLNACSHSRVTLPSPNNVAIGGCGGCLSGSDSNRNIPIGQNALANNTAGINSIAIGQPALGVPITTTGSSPFTLDMRNVVTEVSTYPYGGDWANPYYVRFVKQEVVYTTEKGIEKRVCNVTYCRKNIFGATKTRWEPYEVYYTIGNVLFTVPLEDIIQYK
jgi:hypothetical protein